MITYRTRILLFLGAVCGLGIGVLAPFSDGLYSAALLFCFPFFVAFTALAIGTDLNRHPAAKVAAPVREKRQSAGFATRMPLITSQKIN